MSVLTGKVIAKLQTLAAMNPTKEVCGILDTAGEIHRVTNVSKTPYHCFVYDRREYFALLKKLGETGRDIFCFWHTHPTGDTTPSTADKTFIASSGKSALIVTKATYRWVDHA